MRWLGHPATLLAAIVLLVNDHLLKDVWPGVVTGKLSDVAGLVVAPALLAAFLPHRADLVAVVVTGIGFTVVKTTQTGAELASQAWTLVAGPSTVLADPTDLLALPALWLAWWIRCNPWQVRQAQIALTVPLAVLAITATSAAPGAPQANVVQADPEAITVTGRDHRPFVSRDGGASWQVQDSDEGPPPEPGRTSACVQQHCYRIVAGRMKVMESSDGGITWRVSWEISPGRTKLLDRSFDEPRCCRPIPLQSESLAVQARPGGGHVVVVANERDGIAVRDEAGKWRRLGFAADGTALSQAAALTAFGEHVEDETKVAVLSGLLALVIGIAMSSVRRMRAWNTAAFGIAGLLAMVPYPYPDLVFSAATTFVGMAGATMLLCALIVAVMDLPSPSALLKPLAIGVAVALGVAVPFHGWSAGAPDDYGTALTLAVVFGLGLGGAGLRYLTGSRTSSPT